MQLSWKVYVRRFLIFGLFKELVIVMKVGKEHFVLDKYVLWMKMELFVMDTENAILTQKNVNAMIIGQEKFGKIIIIIN